MVRSAALAALATALLTGCGSSHESAPHQTASAMRLNSPAFADGGTIPPEYTCDGAGRSPPLSWSQPPANTQSFALMVEDPDAPNGTFGHWGVYDLPASTHELAAGASKDIVGGFKQTTNDYGDEGYGPPCPPAGDPPHHYEFHLIALDVAQLPNVPPDATDLSASVDGHVLAEVKLVATYKRG